MYANSLVVFTLLLSSKLSSALWSCSSDLECSSLEGGVCRNGVCGCGPGQQTVNGATVCVDMLLSSKLSSALWSCSSDLECSSLEGGVCRNGVCGCGPGQQTVNGATVCVDMLLSSKLSSALWSCSSDLECSSLEGGVCRNGVCGCGPGQQTVNGATVCVDIAPYYLSACYEDYQCSRLQLRYECYRDNLTDSGSCRCLSGSHYFLGRCWESRDYGEECVTSEECVGLLRDPYSLTCDEGLCECADGYYLRQRGECRKTGLVVGDGCVLDEDCQFQNGACDTSSFTCYDVTESTRIQTVTQTQLPSNMADLHKMAARVFSTCDLTSDCSDEYMECLDGACVCSTGYYSLDGVTCLAELGSPATSDRCVGLLAQVLDGVCACPSNFFYDDNMRDCIKVSRSFSDACGNDQACWTFGQASSCGDPQEPWGLRTCECQSELAVQDSDRNMCRMFKGLGEVCEVDSDCLAGDLEVLCVADDEGTRTCACPDGLTIFEGLCISSGLALGDSCQVTPECTGIENTECQDGVCSCATGYQVNNDICVSVIGGSCSSDAECFTPNSVCRVGDGEGVCQCGDGFIDFEEQCLQTAGSYGSFCNVTAQCTSILGEGSACLEDQCVCVETFHYRGEQCWPVTGLFESCSRTSECYLNSRSELVVCRNGLCQCDFDFPFSEELQTCVFSSGSISSPQAFSFILATVIVFYH